MSAVRSSSVARTTAVESEPDPSPAPGLPRFIENPRVVYMRPEPSITCGFTSRIPPSGSISNIGRVAPNDRSGARTVRRLLPISSSSVESPGRAQIRLGAWYSPGTLAPASHHRPRSQLQVEKHKLPARCIGYQEAAVGTRAEAVHGREVPGNHFGLAELVPGDGPGRYRSVILGACEQSQRHDGGEGQDAMAAGGSASHFAYRSSLKTGGPGVVPRKTS